ncbi:hypothetical protein SAMN05444339_12127 [Loktanella atrilutea]|uniref:Phytanoyl-CoA dioxygenase (PhyH) n=1 Tax=Loktanella atrilutea TaxID=366533 RepID=A0A1M5FJP1_LOKAT|nr:hypothetical protein SAMN05444339_12127 [Loktanella atrilutea]
MNEKRVRRLMRLMGLMPIYQKPNTSKPAKGHKTYPYLLRGLRVERPNQVWCVDITYLPMRRGFLYLVAIMDWHTPRLHAAYDTLVGEGRWLPPQGLGTFPIRFPSRESAGDDGWHVDMSFGTENPDFMEWRANVMSSDRALLMLFLFSDVGSGGAPTRIRKGSHATIARELLPHGKAGATLKQLSAGGYTSTQDCEIALATGEAGTVYLCHPFVVHAAQSHCGTEPRFMAQPPLLPRTEFDPKQPPSAVQVAIRRACNLAI